METHKLPGFDGGARSRPRPRPRRRRSRGIEGGGGLVVHFAGLCLFLMLFVGCCCCWSVRESKELFIDVDGVLEGGVGRFFTRLSRLARFAGLC